MPPSKLRHAAVDTASGGRSAILPLENEGRRAGRDGRDFRSAVFGF